MEVGSCGETHRRKGWLVSCYSSQTRQWKPDLTPFAVAFSVRSARQCLIVKRRNPKISIRPVILNDPLKGRLPLNQDKNSHVD